MAVRSLKVFSNNSCYSSLAYSIGSISIALSSLAQIPNSTDRISLQRGLFLTSMGFIYFISLTDFCNKYLLETKRGLQFQKKYQLMLSDVLEITNKIVSAIQAFFSFLVGLVVCKATCSKSFVYASHFLMEAYGWFGTAYFMYDIWSMYKVHSHKIADKLKLKNLSIKLEGSNHSNRNGNTLDNFITSKKNFTKYENSSHGIEKEGIASANCKRLINSNDHMKFSQNEQKPIDQITTKKTYEAFDNDANLKGEQWRNGSKMDFFKYVITHPIMVIHHVFIGTFGLLVITYIRGGGDCIYSYIYMMEFSTPFVSLRSILSKMHLKNSKLYITNGLIMLVSFFICRVFMWPYVMWRYSLAIDTSFWQALYGLPNGCIIAILILFLPQIYWFYLMVMGALKVFFPSSGQKLQKNPKSLDSTTNHNELLFTNNNSTIEKAVRDKSTHSRLCEEQEEKGHVRVC